MGACLSCLGLNRQHTEEPSETERLLYTSPSNYNSLGASSGLPNGSVDGSNQPADPDELRRQREALERICAETADQLIDVVHFSTINRGNKVAREYEALLEQHFGSHRQRRCDPGSGQGQAEGDAEEEVDEAAWLESLDHDGWDTVKGFKPGTLVVSLDDYAAVDSPAGGKKVQS